MPEPYESDGTRLACTGNERKRGSEPWPGLRECLLGVHGRVRREAAACRTRVFRIPSRPFSTSISSLNSHGTPGDHQRVLHHVGPTRCCRHLLLIRIWGISQKTTSPVYSLPMSPSRVRYATSRRPAAQHRGRRPQSQVHSCARGLERVEVVDNATEQQIRFGPPAELVLQKVVCEAARARKLEWQYGVSDIPEHDDTIIVLRRGIKPLGAR